MRVDELMRSLLRRPVALVLIIVLAVAGALVGYSSAASTYQSSATVLVVPPNAPEADGTPGNPFTRLDFSTSQLALVVATQLDSDAVRDQVVDAGGSGQYDTDTLSGSNSATAQLTPQVRLTATGATPEGAGAAMDVLVDEASTQLAAVQSASNVPLAAQTEIVVSSPASTPVVVGNPQVRAAGVFGIAAGFLSLLAVVAFLPLLERRSRRASPVARVRGRRSRAASKRDATAQRPRLAAVGIVPAAVFEPPVLVQAAGADEPAPELSPPISLRRQEILRQMVRDDYRRTARNIPWSRAEQRAAYLRAEERLAEKELLRDAGRVHDRDEHVTYRDHG